MTQQSSISKNRARSPRRAAAHKRRDGDRAKEDGCALSKKKVCGSGFCGISSHDKVSSPTTGDCQRSKIANQAFVARFCPGRMKAGRDHRRVGSTEPEGSRRIDGRETLWVSLVRWAFIRIFGHFELQYTHLRLIALSNAASASESRKFLTTLSYTCLLYAYVDQAYE
jgi:hypothetical protein